MQYVFFFRLCQDIARLKRKRKDALVNNQRLHGLFGATVVLPLSVTVLQLRPHAQVWLLNATFALRDVAVKSLLKNELEMKPSGEFPQISFSLLF